MEHVFNLMDMNTIPKHIGAAIPWFIWQIWKNINAIIMVKTQVSITTLVQDTLEESKCWRELNEGEANSSMTLLPTRIRDSKWQKPREGHVKYNVSGSWRNSILHCGGAWITRDHTGSVLMHARDAFTRSHNRIIAKFRCLIWPFQSLRDLRHKDIVIASDCKITHETLRKPEEWPRYRVFIEQIPRLSSSFECCSFELEAPSANTVAREIAKSVTRDGRFNSYVALGGPALIHNLLLCDEN